MKKYFLHTIFIFFFSQTYGQNPLDLIDSMINSISEIKTLEYDLKSTELINSKLISTTTKTKFKKTPFSVYSIIVSPFDSLEVLHTNKSEKSLINPNSFPYINLKLNPYGSLMRANQHHTLYDLGFDNFKSIIVSSVEKIGEEFDKYISVLRDKKLDGKSYYVLQLKSPDFKYVEYMVKSSENIEEIAQRKDVSSYLILLKNELSNYDDVENGDKIYIPNSYAESIEIWIDTETYLPLIQKIYLNGELFEHYEYSNVKVNPTFEKNEFFETYKEYGF